MGARSQERYLEQTCAICRRRKMIYRQDASFAVLAYKAGCESILHDNLVLVALFLAVLVALEFHVALKPARAACR